MNSQRNGEVNGWLSCHAHAGRPLLRPFGNPCNSIIVRNEKKDLKTKLDSEHIRRGNIRILPGHVKGWRHMLWDGNPYTCMVYTMVLVGLSLFLRASELLSLRACDFYEKGHIILEDGVSSLVLKVKGKNDNKWIYFKLCRNDVLPWFCPVRHLLYYVEMANLKCPEGYLFFPRGVVEKLHAGELEHSEDIAPMKYKTSLSVLKGIVRKKNPELFNSETATDSPLEVRRNKDSRQTNP